MSPIVTYHTVRDDGLTIAQIQSICRQILSLVDKDEREELARLQRETKALVEKRAASRPEEPWEDAGGVILVIHIARDISYLFPSTASTAKSICGRFVHEILSNGEFIEISSNLNPDLKVCPKCQSQS